MSNHPKIIWHRCNSTGMFLRSLADKNISGIEFDISATKDNVPILFHDKIVEKQISSIDDNGSYVFDVPDFLMEISSLSFEELHKIRPDLDRLEDALAAIDKEIIPSDFEFHLEIKPYDTRLCDAVFSMLSSYPLVDEKTIPRSFQPGNLIHIKKQYPSRRICLLLDDVTYVDHLTEVEKLEYKIAREKLPENIEEIIKICGGYKPEYISVRFNMLTDEFVSLMQKEGVRLDVYTLNDLDDLKCQLPEGVVTDRPENILDK